MFVCVYCFPFFLHIDYSGQKPSPCKYSDQTQEKQWIFWLTFHVKRFWILRRFLSMNVIANYLPTLIYVQSDLNLVSVPKASAVASFFSWQFLKHSVSDAHLILSCAKSVHTKKKPKLMCLFQSTMGAFSKAPVGCLFQSTCRLNYAFS